MKKGFGLRVLAVFMGLQMIGHLESAHALGSPPYQSIAIVFATCILLVAAVDLVCALGFWFLKPWAISVFWLWLVIHAVAVAAGTVWFLATPPYTAMGSAVAVSLSLVFGLVLYLLQRFVRSKVSEFI